MPFLHLDKLNRNKKLWYNLVKDHPSQFEVLEWSIEQDRDLIQRSYPDLDLQLYPVSCISILASLQKLIYYGGIAVRGELTEPTRGIKIILNDWKTLGPPRKLTVRGYRYPVTADKTTIMVADCSDYTALSYRDRLLRMMSEDKVWKYPEFGSDVSIM